MVLINKEILTQGNENQRRVVLNLIFISHIKNYRRYNERGYSNNRQNMDLENIKYHQFQDGIYNDKKSQIESKFLKPVPDPGEHILRTLIFSHYSILKFS
jgi:hypothetical protein